MNSLAYKIGVLSSQSDRLRVFMKKYSLESYKAAKENDEIDVVETLDLLKDMCAVIDDLANQMLNS